MSVKDDIVAMIGSLQKSLGYIEEAERMEALGNPSAKLQWAAAERETNEVVHQYDIGFGDHLYKDMTTRRDYRNGVDLECCCGERIRSGEPLNLTVKGIEWLIAHTGHKPAPDWDPKDIIPSRANNGIVIRRPWFRGIPPPIEKKDEP